MYILRCIKCNAIFESDKTCYAVCACCKHIHACNDVEVIDDSKEEEKK